MRKVELANQRRRDIGLEFWSNYPNDPRRYSWLVMAVHMAPEYPADIKRWSQFKSDPTVVDYGETNMGAVTRWNSKYSGLRQEFWESEHVTDEQRRFLWYGELVNTILDVRRCKSRGGDCDVDAFLTDYLAFLSNYSNPFPDSSVLQSERNFHYQILNSLFVITFDSHRDTYDWEPATVLSYLTAVSEHWPSPSVFQMMAFIEDTGKLPPPTGGGFFRADDLSVDQKAWRWTEQQYFETVRVSDTATASLIYAYHDLVRSRRVRAMGVILWRTNPDRTEQLRWVASLLPLDDSRYHVVSIEDHINLISDGREDEIRKSATSIAEWRKRLDSFRTDFLSSEDTTDSDRSQWLLGELGYRKRELDKRGPDSLSQKEIEQFQSDVFLLAAEFRELQSASSLLSDIVSYPKRYGFTDDSLPKYIDSFRNLDDTAIDNVVRKYDWRQLAKTTPVSFQAPLFNSADTFDISELRGKVVYLDPWATWCGSCIQYMPELHEIYLEYRDRGFEVVSMPNDAQARPKGVQRIVDTLNLSWPIVVSDDLHVSRPYLNAYLLLGRDGSVLKFIDRAQGPPLREILDEVFDE